MLLALLAAPVAAQRPGGGAEPGALALVDAWIEAAGGAGVWDGVRTLRYTATTVWYDSAGQERRRRPRHVWIEKAAGGFRVRVERTEAEGTYVQVQDTGGVWATLDGRALPDTARAVREIAYVAGDLTYWPGLPWKLRDPGVNLRHLPSDPHAAGRAVHVTFGEGVGLHDQDRFWWYFGDASSPLPTEVHYVEQGHPPEDRQRARLEWRRTGRVVHMGRRVYVRANGLPRLAIVYGDIRPNVELEDAVFTARRPLRAPRAPR